MDVYINRNGKCRESEEKNDVYLIAITPVVVYIWAKFDECSLVCTKNRVAYPFQGAHIAVQK